jgi:hypothetical protein
MMDGAEKSAIKMVDHDYRSYSSTSMQLPIRRGSPALHNLHQNPKHTLKVLSTSNLHLQTHVLSRKSSHCHWFGPRMSFFSTCTFTSDTLFPQGIGATVAVALAKEGANVVVNYVSPSSKVHAESVAKAIEGTGSRALVVQADLASVQALELLVQKTVEQFGKIDILVSPDRILI